MSETSEKYMQQIFFDTDTSISLQGSDVSLSASSEQTIPSASEPLQLDSHAKISAQLVDKPESSRARKVASGKKLSGFSKSAMKQASSLTTSSSKMSETSSQAETGKKRKRPNSKKQKHNTRMLPFAQLIAEQWMKPQMNMFSEHGWASYSQTWPDVGMMRNGQCYPLPTSAPHISENESSLWRTPTKSESPNRKLPSPMGSVVRLSQQVFANGKIQRIWPTPNASNSNEGETLTSWLERRERVKAQKKNGNGFGIPLAIAVRLWPTPAAQDSKNATLPPSQVERDTLPGARLRQAPGLWSPPQADENGSIKSPEERAGHNLSLSNQVQGSLNPSWVETLMGLPIGWTDIDGQPDQESNNIPGNLQEPSKEKTA